SLLHSSHCYSLSLHDALPIYPWGSRPRVSLIQWPISPRFRSTWRVATVETTTATRSLNPDVFKTVAEVYPDVLLIPENELMRYLDRKSTRLNSSHEWISYAVF